MEDAHPRDLRLAQTSYGKPFPVRPPGADDIRFNLSHSHGLALYAVARGRPKGMLPRWRWKGKAGA